MPMAGLKWKHFHFHCMSSFDFISEAELAEDAKVQLFPPKKYPRGFRQPPAFVHLRRRRWTTG